MGKRPARMREAHAHVLAHGRAMDMVQLNGCTSAEEMLDAIADAAVERRVVLAHGTRPEAWLEPGWPTLERLDHASPEASVAAWCFDYHAIMLNSRALESTGVGIDTPDPKGGQIGRRPDGSLTGVLYEAAVGMAWGKLEPTGIDEDALARAIEDLAEHGFTHVHDLKAQPGLGEALAATSTGSIEFTLYPLVQDLPEVLKRRRDWETDRVRLGGGKIFVDGTLNSRTAWMLHPFADGRTEHPAGMQLMSDRQIEDAMRLCVGEGLQLAAHAIGDAAVRAVLDAAERVRAPRGSVRIEHAELIDEADVPRFAELGVIASVQPCHLLYDIEALRRACPDRLDRVLPLRELIDSGLTPGRDLLFGSDTPIVRPDPEDSILAATNRGRSDMALAEGIAPDQAISEAEAWACFDADA
ncbi:MAG: amidohydrolase family protein [Phycisphaerales bacterium]